MQLSTIFYKVLSSFQAAYNQGRLTLFISLLYQKV